MSTVASPQPTAQRIEIPEWSEATRLMCVAAYTQRTFAQDVFDEIIEERHRSIQVPPGVDASPVLKHCLAARHSKTLRDQILAGILVLAVLLLFVTASLLPIVLGFGVAWAVVAYDVWNATQGVVAKRLSRAAFDPDEAPDPGSEDAQRIATVVDGQSGNLTVYSGFLPFSGSGFDLDGWSFVVDLRKGKDVLGARSDAQPIAAGELYARVDAALESLGDENLVLEDRVFVNGTDVRGDPMLMPTATGLPRSSLTDEQLDRVAANPSHRMRHYKCIRIVDWRGELVVSRFLRLAVAHDRLFCELSAFLLTPLTDDLRRSDGGGAELDLREFLRMASATFLSTGWLLYRSPTVVIRPLQRQRRQAKDLRRVKQDPFYDHGARTTALDRVRRPDYQRYFQLLDKERHVKVLERAILDAIVEGLDARGIDTSEIVERRSTIVNNGIMVPGGTVQAENIAVGAGARIASTLSRAGKTANARATGPSTQQPSGRTL